MTMQVNKGIRSASNMVTLKTGAQLHIVREGDGDELVLFIHAVGSDHRSWSSQMAALEGSPYTTCALDLRGHGKSKYPGKDIYEAVTIQAFAADVIALIDQLGYLKAHLVGISMGAVVALEVFKQSKSSVQSLLLANSWAHHPQGNDKIAFMKDRLSNMTLAESAAGMVANLLAPGTDRKILDECAEIEGSKDKDVFLSSWISMFADDYRPLLPSIDVPLMLIGGTLDEITPTTLMAEIHEAVTTSQLVDIDGAGHFSNLDHSEEFNRLMIVNLRRGRLPESQRKIFAPTQTATLKAHTVAQGLMELINKRGIDYFFSNSGTDFTPIIDALARYSDDPTFTLEPIVAPHENTAIAMAHGYFLLSGKPQALMAHVNVGTANMGLGIINASRSHIPMLVMAGKSPWYEQDAEGCRTNFVQWGQDTFDQAAYFREFTKWDYELKSGQNLETVVDRALAISKSDPAGPVYLTLPKEALCERVDSLTYSLSPRQQATAASEPSQEAIAKAAQLIAEAKHPLIITAELGRYQGGVEALVQLAQRHAIPVIEHGKHNFFNFPSNHPMHLGFNPSPEVEQADLIIAIESHVPWIPALTKMPGPLEQSPTLIQIGVDPLCGDIPMRSFPADIALSGNPAKTLSSLLDALSNIDGNQHNSQRHEAVSNKHKQYFASAQKEALADEKLNKITKRFLSYCIGKVVDDDCVIFNEYNLDPALVPRHLTDSWFENSIASGLGWSLGAALGAQLAAPEQTMIATVGDGSYMFNTPLSAHYAAEAHKLPIVIIVFNDSAWSTIKKSYLGTTKDGWAEKHNHFQLCDFDINIAFEKLAESCGGIGLRVETPSELIATLKKAISITRTDKQHVLVNVICEKDV